MNCLNAKYITQPFKKDKTCFNSKLLNANKSKLTRGTAKNHLINKMGVILLILLVKGDEFLVFSALMN